MNTKLRKEAKGNLEKDFFKLLNNSVFGKRMKNVRDYRDIKIVTTKKEKNRLVLEPNYHTTKYISKKLLIKEMKKAKVRMTKPLYLGLSMLDISKTLMYKFWYDFIKPKYGYKAQLCYIDTDSFFIYIKTEDFYEDISDDIER